MSSSFTQSKASSYGLTGWVENTSGGQVRLLLKQHEPQERRSRILTPSQVEGEAQGDDEGIQKLLKVLESGPPAASVTKVDKSEIDVKEGESSYMTK